MQMKIVAHKIGNDREGKSRRLFCIRLPAGYTRTIVKVVVKRVEQGDSAIDRADRTLARRVSTCASGNILIAKQMSCSASYLIVSFIPYFQSYFPVEVA